MSRMFRILGISVAAVTMLLAGAARADDFSDANGTVRDSHNVLRQIMQSESIPMSTLHQARGIVILPSVIKAGVIVGGQGGKGVVLARLANGKFGPPAFVSIAGGSVGLQLGAQKSTIVLLLQSDAAVSRLASGKVKLGTDLTVTAGPKGAKGTSSERADVYAYVQTKGAFVGASIAGASINFSDKLASAYYGRSVSGQRLLFAQVPNLTVPPDAESLRMELSQSTHSK